jgi:photosystem II stability/assembly factor-like uncharacterized protein
VPLLSKDRNRTFLIFLGILAGCQASSDDYRWHVIQLESGASLRGISVLNEQVAWVTGTGGTIFKTEDGGNSWESIVIPDTQSLDFRDVETLSINEIVVMSIGTGDPSKVFKTWDGGKNWSKVLQYPFEAGFFDGMAFGTNGIGILGGDPLGDEMHLLKTVDGGNSWSRIDPATLPPVNPGEFGGFAASGSHVAIFENSVWVGSVAATSRIFHSDDLGQSWQVFDTPIIQGKETQGIFSLAFIDRNTGVAVGGDYKTETEGVNNVMLTSDGGASWRLAKEFPVFQSAVRYLDENNLLSVGPAASYHSDDGGNTWRQIPGDGFHTLSVSADGIAWAAGADGRIARLERNR